MSGGPGRGGRQWLFAGLLIAAVALIYGRTLRYDFVNYDDYDLIVANTAFLADPGNILDAFTTHAFSTHREEGVYYRPVLMTTYILDYQFWGTAPGGYHFTNLLLHALSSVLFFFLARELAGARAAGSGRTGQDRALLAALFGGLFFALHPVQTEAVAWVAGRNDVLLGLFVILFLLFYIRSSGREGARAGSRTGWSFPAALFFYAMALLTKEPAVFFVLLAPLYELTAGGKSFVSLFSGRTYRRMIALAAVTAAYLGVRYWLFGAFVGSEDLYGKIPLENRFLMAPGLFTKNLLFVLWPFSPNIAHPIENVPWFESPWLFLALALAASSVFAAVAFFRRAPLVAWAVLWVLVGMVPLLNIFPLAVPILEHRLYTTVAGFGLALALLFPGSGTTPRMAGVAPAAAGGLCALLAVMTFVRLPVWENSESLWKDAIAKEPASARARFNLAGYYFEKRQYDSTLVHLERYVELRPGDMLGYSKLRQTYFLAGRIGDAARVCRKLIDLDPDNVHRYLEAGLLYERIGLSDSVIGIYREGIRTDSGFYQLRQKLGMWYAATGDTAGARAQYELAIGTLETLGRYAPLSGDQLALLAGLYRATGRTGKIDSLSRPGGVPR